MTPPQDFAARLQEALTDTPALPLLPEPAPLQVSVVKTRLFRWRSTIIRDENGQICEAYFEPVAQVPWISLESNP